MFLFNLAKIIIYETKTDGNNDNIVFLCNQK